MLPGADGPRATPQGGGAADYPRPIEARGFHWPAVGGAGGGPGPRLAPGKVGGATRLPWGGRTGTRRGRARRRRSGRGRRRLWRRRRRSVAESPPRPQVAAPELQGASRARGPSGQDGGPAGRGAARAVLRAALVGSRGPRRGSLARRVRLGGTLGCGRAGGGRSHGRGRRGRAEESSGAAGGSPRTVREPAHLRRRVRRVGPGQRREPLLQHLRSLALLLGRLLGR